MPKLSVCTIFQDSAPYLRRFLENVAPVADEIVLVDGGSRDGSEAIVRAHPRVRYFQRAFDDFPAQKNFAIDQATGDWVLLLDADELISDSLAARLPRLIRSRWYHWYKLPRYWLVSEDPPRYVHADSLYPDWLLRLFRNEPFFRYEPERKVHERFPRRGRGLGRKLRDSHLIHLALLGASREERLTKTQRYASIDRGSEDTNRMYLWEELPHELRPCRDTWRPRPNGEEL